MDLVGKHDIGTGLNAVFFNELDTSRYTAIRSDLAVGAFAYTSNPDPLDVTFKIAALDEVGGNLPNNVLGITAPITLPTGSPQQWRYFDFLAPFQVVAGTVYHVGHFGYSPSSGVSVSAKFGALAPVAGAGSWTSNANTVFPNLTTPVGASNVDNVEYSIYLVGAPVVVAPDLSLFPKQLLRR